MRIPLTNRKDHPVTKDDDVLIVTYMGAKAVCRSIYQSYKDYGFVEKELWDDLYKHFVGLPVSIVRHKIHRGPRGRYYPEDEIQVLRDTATRRKTAKSRKALERREEIKKLRKKIEDLGRIDNL
jgi:hypothetical protein